jgi:AraC-like DNA-binding protein
MIHKIEGCDGSGQLQKYVKEVFTLQSHQVPGKRSFKYYADGLPGLMYQESEKGMTLNGKRLPNLFLYGQTVKPVEIQAEGNFKMIIFYFYAHVIKNLFRVNAETLVDNCLDVSKLSVEGSGQLLMDVQKLRYMEQQTKLIARFLTKLIPRDNTYHDIERVISGIQLSNNTFKFTSTSSEGGVTQRSIQRLFKKHVGVSPRMFARISKFNSAFQKLKTSEFKSLSELAHHEEYSDQSHFIRTFKEFTGLSPKQFIARLRDHE